METINFPNSPNFLKSITCIEVEKLFGKYNYKLQKENNSYSNNSLMILYGDNGSGKTTILKLLFHTLSAASERGHRTFIAKTSFLKFSVEFTDKTKILITRDNSLKGSFEIVCLKHTEEIAKTIYKFENGKLDSEDEPFLEKFSDLNLNLFILGDDRTLDSNIFYSQDNNSKERIIDMDSLSKQLEILRSQLKGLHRQSNDNLKSALESSIQRVEEWIRDQAYQGSDRGEKDVHSIYEEIVQSIVMPEKENSDSFEYEFTRMIESFEKQEKRSREYSRFGLIPPLSTKKLIDILQKSSSDTYPVLQKILTPYLGSITARMNALQSIQEILTTFVNTINQGFLHDKKIKFHLRDGLEILTKEKGKEISLDPEMLSSGEKQLLLLFCNTFAARERATIFIIDEPEISLNIKWQRQLIQSLLKCTEGSQIQFLLATHSIELLSQYDNDVVDLENIEEATEHGEEKTRETTIAS
ncbi:MAG: ATP-binding protein [Cyanobacteria bacterium SBLK]|nr:ATP-binding protein [Cyanobacteria bacterium SBLK]